MFWLSLLELQDIYFGITFVVKITLFLIWLFKKAVTYIFLLSSVIVVL